MHKAAEVSRSHSTSIFFFLEEGSNIRVQRLNCKVSMKTVMTANPCFFNGLLPEARAEPEGKARELSCVLHRERA